MTERYDLAIINRGFWPSSQILGEGLLQLAEQNLKQLKSVVVITQSNDDLPKLLAQHERGQGLAIQACKARSTSASGLVLRLIDALIFMLWVFWSLLIKRPKLIYVATDPPLFAPLMVYLYAIIFRARYVYHLQDIHPEAANSIIRVNPLVYKITRWLDSLIMRRASALITITNEMKQSILLRSSTKSPVFLVDNPSVPVECEIVNKEQGFAFCGNAGRLQRIPLLLDAIELYKKQGGKLPFVFAGGGVFKEQVKALSETTVDVSYLGMLSAADAACINARYEWALLPIEDEVTLYAFPSKTSAYVLAGSKVLSICSDETSVAKWVNEHGFGINVKPELTSLVNTFFAIEKHQLDVTLPDVDYHYYSIQRYANQLNDVLEGVILEKTL
jgi:hypothetical protein